MSEAQKTSFIPKQTMGAMPGRAPRRRRHFNVFSFIGMVVFLCGIILAVGTFVYKNLNEKELANKKAELQQAKSSFSQGDIENLRELDRRINVSKALLDQHLAPSVVFDMLERRTQKDVQFTEFTYDRRESGSVEMTLNGNALRFNTVALQSRQLASAAALESVIFSDLNVGSEGEDVTFKVTAQADTDALKYTALPIIDQVEATSSSTDDFFSNQRNQTTGTSSPNTP